MKENGMIFIYNKKIIIEKGMFINITLETKRCLVEKRHLSDTMREQMIKISIVQEWEK